MGILKKVPQPGWVRGSKCRFYILEGGGGNDRSISYQEDAKGIFYQEGGTIQGFETPIRILGILKKVPQSGWVRGSKCRFYILEGGGGNDRSISYQEVGANQGFETPIRILGILKIVPPCGGEVKGVNLDFLH